MNRRRLKPPERWTELDWFAFRLVLVVLAVALAALTLPYCYPAAELVQLQEEQLGH